MNENIADILSDCLDCLFKGESVEACLARYPERAEELEPLLRTAALTLSLSRISPDPARKEAAKQRFLDRARRETPPQPRLILFTRRFRAVAASFAATFLLAAAMAGAIAVSADSTPDDPAYPLKRAAESVQLIFSLGEERTAFHVELADRRLSELERIAARSGVVNIDLLAEVTKETDEVVAGLDKADKKKEELGEKLFRLTARQQEVLRRVASKTHDGDAEGLERAIDQSRHGHEVAATVVARERLDDLERESKTPSPRSTATRPAPTATSEDKSALPKSTPGGPSPTAERHDDESEKSKGGNRSNTPTATTSTPTADPTSRRGEEQRTPTARASTPTPTPKGRDDDDKRQSTPTATATASSTPKAQLTPRSGEATSTPRPVQPTPTVSKKEGESDD